MKQAAVRRARKNTTKNMLDAMYDSKTGDPVMLLYEDTVKRVGTTGGLVGVSSHLVGRRVRVRIEVLNEEDSAGKEKD